MTVRLLYLTLLCLSSVLGGVEGAEEFAGDVALEAADVVVGFAFGAPLGDVVLGPGAAAPASECEAPPTPTRSRQHDPGPTGTCGVRI